MSDRTDEHVTTIGVAASHIARGCRASTSHDPSVYLRQIDEAVASLAADAAETNRLRNRLRDAPLGGDGSHWDGCHLVHIDCARAHIERVEAQRDAAVADRDRLAKALDHVDGCTGLCVECQGRITAALDGVKGRGDEPREGIVMVYHWDGRYLGCMGIETWDAHLAGREGSELPLAVEPPAVDAADVDALVVALQKHKARIQALQETLCECDQRHIFQAELHDKTCPVRAGREGSDDA